jgi:hypothetical protein
MKKFAKILLILVTFYTIVLSESSTAKAQEVYASNYVMAKYDQDFISCSDTARKATPGMSDVAYMGAFYGCMVNLGYNTAELF